MLHVVCIDVNVTNANIACKTIKLNMVEWPKLLKVQFVSYL